MGAARAWDKPRGLVIELVKRLSSFRIKSQRNLRPIMIGPCSSVNRQQADVNMRVNLLLRNAMQFSKSEHGNQVPGQRTGGSLAWTPRGKRLCPGYRRSREQLLDLPL